MNLNIIIILKHSKINKLTNQNHLNESTWYILFLEAIRIWSHMILKVL